MTLRLRSVRTRLTLWHAGVLTAVVCAFSAAIFFFVRVQLYRDLDVQLEHDLATVERTFREDPTDLREAESRAGIGLFEVIGDGGVLYRTDAWVQKGFERTVRDHRDTAPFSSVTSERQPYRLRTLASAAPRIRISIAKDESAVRRTLRILGLILALGIPFAVALAIAGGHFLAGRVLAPVGAMAERARRITVESLDARLPVEDPEDEFGRLAGVFNETLARLQDSFERLRRFTADASHELRTPLTAIRSVGEVALQGSLDPPAYREVIGSMLEEVERLTGLVESLLTLTRADSGRLCPAREVVDLGALAASVAEHLRVLAEEKEQDLLLDGVAAVRAQCDPAMVRRGLVNLVDNAIKYTPPGGAIRLTVRVLASGEAAVEVSDNGPGIAIVHQERVFERFYRVHADRSKHSGGTGLGLAIARSIVAANGGRIELESAEGRGSVFRVVLPVG
jgi:heavy metal sensor kinase